MRIADLNEAIAAAKDFLRTAKQVQQEDQTTRRQSLARTSSPYVEPTGSRMNGLLRARSVILSHALLDLRK